jgi:hypothetical protein
VRRLPPLLAAGLCALAAVGCEDELPRASLIASVRVLGARSEVAGDPSRSNPHPGEAARLTWDMVYPSPSEDDSELRSLFIACTAPERFSGVPICQELIELAAGGAPVKTPFDLAPGMEAPECDGPGSELEYGPVAISCVQGTPTQLVRIAEDFRAKAKLILGIICKNGLPRFDPNAPTFMRCEKQPGVSDADLASIPVYGTIAVDPRDAEENHNPDIAAATFLFGEGERRWEPLSDEERAELDDDCGDAASAGRILSSNGAEEQLAIEYDDSVREALDGEPEVLEFSAYTTFGELSRRFTVFDASSKLPLHSELTWEVEQAERDELGDRSRLVRFFFTLIDRRGGYAVTQRELCVGRDLTQ